MALNFGKSNTPSDNTFVVKETIQKAERVEKFPYGTRANDVVLKLTFSEVEYQGKKFTPEMFVMGDFKRDSQGKVTGWGSAFKVRNVFNACGVAGSVDDNGNIPQALIDSLAGHEVYVLKYVFKDDGKKHYKLWSDMMLGVDSKEPVETLKKAFFDSYLKGYPKDFVPVAEVQGDIPTDAPMPGTEVAPEAIDW